MNAMEKSVQKMMTSLPVFIYLIVYDCFKYVVSISDNVPLNDRIINEVEMS